ncbi:MAG: ATPase, partial [Nitrospiraceae bacterium]
PDNARRVRTLMRRYPMRIWEECAHWMNMLGEWVPIGDLCYSLSMHSLFRWGHLHDWVKRKTADFQRLPMEILQTQPFVSLQPLSSLVEERFEQLPLFKGTEDRREWLTAFGNQARRIDLPTPEETESVRQTATLIARTIWVEAAKLEVVPYLEGVPAGTARLADILWLDDRLYVSPLSKAKLAKRVPEEVGKSLNSDIRAALAYAFERSLEDIKAYLEENFTLVPEHDVEKLAIDEDLPTASGGRNAASENEASFADDVTAPNGLEDDVIEDESEDETNSPAAADQTGDDAENEFIAPQPERKPRPPAAPRGPSLMTRFAGSLGFKADGEDRFFHSDGSWISRSDGARFPWEHRTASGEVLRYYFPKEHCIKRDPMQIEADIWGLLEQKPNLYAFVLIDTEGNPIEITGERFRALREDGDISLHPATYRLVFSEPAA